MSNNPERPKPKSEVARTCVECGDAIEPNTDFVQVRAEVHRCFRCHEWCIEIMRRYPQRPLPQPGGLARFWGYYNIDIRTALPGADSPFRERS